MTLISTLTVLCFLFASCEGSKLWRSFKGLSHTEWLVTTKQAQTVLNAWLKQYNHIRPHQAQNMKPPAPETLLKNGT